MSKHFKIDSFQKYRLESDIELILKHKIPILLIKIGEEYIAYNKDTPAMAMLKLEVRKQNHKIDKLRQDIDDLDNIA